MKKKLLIALSYVAVAAAAVALTLVFTAKPAHYTKLEELADLLEVIHGLYLPMDIRWRIWSVSVSKKQRNVVDSLKEFSLWEWRNHNGFRTS